MSVRNNPETVYANDYNSIIDTNFSNAPNVETDIQTETNYGSKIFSTISQVRVDSVINVTTGQNLGDDFKRFIFDSSFATPHLGQLFMWKGSYWLATNSDNYQSLSKAIIVRRCNNVLRWKDSYDNLIVEPCILSYVLKEPGDYTTSQMVLTSGFVNLFCQRNSRTNSIKANKRFLFGVPTNRSSYRVYGNGIKTFLNSVTSDETSPSVSEFYMGASFINEMTDDIENGVADAYRNEYELNISDGDIIQTVGFTKTLSVEVKHNGTVVDSSLVWSTDDSEIVSITEDGVITCNALGSAVIKCKMENNESVYDEVTIYVSEELSNNYDVVISPETQIIYEGETQEYSCILTNNGTETPAIFTVTATGVPTENYELSVIGDNAFKIKNIKRYLGTKLLVTCSSAEYNKTFEVNLRGDF